MHFYSIIIPVFNRPDEIKELLESLKEQSYKKFEVIIVEDGSTLPCEDIVLAFRDRLDIKYFFKENTGQGFSRNFGFSKAKGDYLIVFDSDCILPSSYMQSVDDHLGEEALDAFGGPDKANDSFTDLQKAINYSMTSFFTTGGIRGNKKHAGPYHPRSFNMGISNAVYQKTKGYKLTRMGEDIEFSIRIKENGFTIGLIEEAFVYHKRRTSLTQFYRQLFFFGRARVNISRFYPEEVKLVHYLPLAHFLAWLGFFILWIVSRPIFTLAISVVLCYYAVILLHSTQKNRSLNIGLLSVLAVFVQLNGYALGMISEFFRRPPAQQVSE